MTLGDNLDLKLGTSPDENDETAETPDTYDAMIVSQVFPESNRNIEIAGQRSTLPNEDE